MKNIIIGKNNVQMMSFEEVHARWEALIKNCITSWINQYEYDELYQIASIALWKAYRDYNAETTVGFGYFSKTYITHDLLRYNQKHAKRFIQKTSRVTAFKSLNEIMYPSIDGNRVELQDNLAMSELFTEKIIDRIFADQVLSACNSRQRKRLELYIAGYSYKEIGKVEGITGQAIQNDLKIAFNKIRNTDCFKDVI